jgi:hypothetical protein
VTGLRIPSIAPHRVANILFARPAQKEFSDPTNTTWVSRY